MTGTIVWHTDRLHRSPRGLEEFIDVCDARGVVLETVRAGPLDLSSPAGRAVARTLLREALERAQAGKIAGGGSRPYGYEEDRRTIRPAGAQIIRECACRLLVKHERGEHGSDVLLAVINAG